MVFALITVPSHPIVAQSQEGQKGTADGANAVDQGAPQRQAAPDSSSEMEIEQLKKRLNQLEQTAEQFQASLPRTAKSISVPGKAVSALGHRRQQNMAS
jgi:hypothetical protein